MTRNGNFTCNCFGSPAQVRQMGQITLTRTWTGLTACYHTTAASWKAAVCRPQVLSLEKGLRKFCCNCRNAAHCFRASAKWTTAAVPVFSGNCASGLKLKASRFTVTVIHGRSGQKLSASRNGGHRQLWDTIQRQSMTHTPATLW